MDDDVAATVTANPTTVGALYTTAEVATMLRVNQRTVQEWVRTGALAADRVDLKNHSLTFETLKKRKRGVYRAVPVPPELVTMLDHVHDLRRAQRRKD